MSLTKTNTENIKNPFLTNKKIINREDIEIELNMRSIARYFKKVYILCPLNLKEDFSELNYPYVNSENLEKYSSSLVLYQVPNKILKNKLHLENTVLINTLELKEILSKFNHFDYSISDEILIIPILNIKLLDLQNYLKIYDGIIHMKDIFNILVLSDYFCNPCDKFKNGKYIFSLINNLEEANYWTYSYNCGLNLSTKFKGRNFTFKIVKTTNIKSNSDVGKVLSDFKKKECNKTQEEGNYLEMIFKSKSYVDVSSIIMKKGYRLFNVNPKCEYSNVEINQLFLKLNKKQQYMLFCKLLVSKKYCHLILNNKEMLINMKSIIHKYAPLMRYLMGYSWIRFYTEESVKKRNITDDDQFVFSIDTAHELPVFPVLHSEPQLNPYLPMMVSNSKAYLNPNENISGFPCYLNSRFQNKGITDLAGFKKRMNIYITCKDEDIFKDIDFEKYNMAIVGSSILACSQEEPPVMEMFKKINGNNDTFENLWIRYFNEYFCGRDNKKGDVDVQIVCDDTFSFFRKVNEIYNQMVVNFCNIFQPYAEPSHLKLNHIKTIFLFVTEEFIKKTFSDSEKNTQYICGNLNDESILKLFEPYFKKRYAEWIKDKLAEYSEDEKIEIEKNYPDFFQMDTVVYQVSLSNKNKNNTSVRVNSTINYTDEEIELILEEENIFIKNNLVVEKNINIDGLGIAVSNKYIISSPMLNNDFEVFPIRRSHWTTVWTFHLPCARARFTGKDVKMLPSFIFALLTYMNIDWRYVAGQKDICDIIGKYRYRMIGTYLNKKEISSYLQYNSRIMFWNNLYNLNLNDKKTYKNCLGTRSINDKLYKIRLFNMESFMMAPPINLDEGYNDAILSLNCKEVKNYADMNAYMVSRFGCLDLSKFKILHNYKTIDVKTGYILPLKSNIIESVYEYSDDFIRI